MVGNGHFDDGHLTQRIAFDNSFGLLGDLEREECPHFDCRESSVLSLVNRIKIKASLWVVAGVKCLATLLARE
jgi:hypothetical protein